jgi:hypothetical protein
LLSDDKISLELLSLDGMNFRSPEAHQCLCEGIRRATTEGLELNRVSVLQGGGASLASPFTSSQLKTLRVWLTLSNAEDLKSSLAALSAGISTMSQLENFDYNCHYTAEA